MTALRPITIPPRGFRACTWWDTLESAAALGHTAVRHVILQAWWAAAAHVVDPLLPETTQDETEETT